MDLLPSDTKPFVIAASGWLRDEVFTVVDVGCAGGVGAAWLGIGNKLRVLGIDTSAAEVAALNAQHHDGDHCYLQGFVTIPADHPYARSRGTRAHLQNNPWPRLAIDWWQQLRTDRAAPVYDRDRCVNVDCSSVIPDGEKAMDLPSLLRNRRIDIVDYIKIDVDGSDIDIIHSLDDVLQSKRVLALGVEVNFFGTSDLACNTFSNVDRFLRDMGFELFDLTTRKYANRALPAGARSRPYPAETIFGRILQGDAFYARDLAAHDLAEPFTADSLIKLAAIFSQFDMPDCAAEVLVRFRDSIGERICADGLELLAAQATRGPQWTYPEYLEAFKDGHPYFSP